MSGDFCPGDFCQGDPLERIWDQKQRTHWKKNGTRDRYIPEEHGTRQTASDIIQRPPPPCEQNNWHTPVKTLPRPKLRLRTAIARNHSSRMHAAYLETECWAFPDVTPGGPQINKFEQVSIDHHQMSVAGRIPRFDVQGAGYPT